MDSIDVFGTGDVEFQCDTLAEISTFAYVPLRSGLSLDELETMGLAVRAAAPILRSLVASESFFAELVGSEIVGPETVGSQMKDTDFPFGEFNVDSFHRNELPQDRIVAEW